MTAMHHSHRDRREAISRAARAVVQLRVEPSVAAAAHRQNVIVNDTAKSDREVREAVEALEDMLVQLGIVNRDDLEPTGPNQGSEEPVGPSFITTADLWRQQGRAMGAYDATGKSLTDLADDYVATHAVYAVAAANSRSNPTEPVDALQADLAMARLALIEEAIETHGGAVDDCRDDGDARIYGPGWTELARF